MVRTAVGPVESGFLVLEYIPGDDRPFIAAEGDLGDVGARRVCSEIFPQPSCLLSIPLDDFLSTPLAQWFSDL